MVKRERQCHRCKLRGGTRWAITWVLTAGVALVFAYRTRDGVMGSRTIFGWLPIIISLSLMLLHNALKLVAQRGSPSFRKGLGNLVSEVVLGGTAVGTVAALVFAAPPLPDLQRFATGVGGTAFLSSVGALLITYLVWARIRRARPLRGATRPGDDA